MGRAYGERASSASAPSESSQAAASISGLTSLYYERSLPQAREPQCLHFYYYFMDRDFGLIHVRIQSWFPMQIQVYVNGHEWLARKLEAHGIVYSKLDNVLVSVGDITKAQKFADRFHSLNTPIKASPDAVVDGLCGLAELKYLFGKRRL